MRKINSLGLKMCTYQADVFESSLDMTQCSSRIFIRRFMNSDIVKNMDKNSVPFESSDVSDVFTELDEQYGESSYGKEKYSAEQIRWIGYIYRYWAFVSEKPSSSIYKLMKPEELGKLYLPYHTLDPMQAIERMQEEIGSEHFRDAGDIARGVEVLRKVRAKNSNQ